MAMVVIVGSTSSEGEGRRKAGEEGGGRMGARSAGVRSPRGERGERRESLGVQLITLQELDT